MNDVNTFIDKCILYNKRLWLRSVIVPGINDNKEYILNLKEYISRFNNIEKVELLPYSTFGVHKYKELNIPYKLDNIKDLTEDKLRELTSYLN